MAFASSSVANFVPAALISTVLLLLLLLLRHLGQSSAAVLQSRAVRSQHC
jgi:hypothetical protein